LPPERRATAFGVISAALSLAAAAGPAVGGILAASFGWRAVFVANLPITITALALALRYVPPDPVRVEMRRFRIDLLGALLLIGSISSVAAPLQLLSSGFVTAAQLPWIYAGSLLCVAAFIVWEARHSDPLIQVRLYLVGSYRAAVTGDFLAYIALFPITVAMSIFLQDTQDRSAIVTGLVLSFGAIGSALIAPFGGRLADRMGRRTPILIGRASSALGLVLLLFVLSEGTSPFLLAAGLTVLSLGGGLATAASQAAAVESAPREFSGMAAGVAATTGFLGGIVGTTVASVYLGESPEFGQFQVLLGGFAGATLLAVAVATRVRPWPGKSTTS
jgi:DHA2 family methylenomycin A resistance protein-like MFS transporter